MKLLLIFFVSIAVSLVIPSLSEASNEKMNVLIDPGHGGTDQGAVRKNYVEAELTLVFAKKLLKKLNQNSVFAAKLTRYDDSYLSLNQREELSQRKGSDLFVSIHANASIDPRARGVEFYFQNPLEGEEISLYLASVEQKNHHILKEGKVKAKPTKSDIQSIIDDLKRQNRIWLSQELSRSLYKTWDVPYSKKRKNAVRQAPFYLVSNVQIPSVLIEIGYISNPNEAKRLHRSGYQNQIVEKIYEGIVKYKEIVDKSANTRLN